MPKRPCCSPLLVALLFFLTVAAPVFSAELIWRQATLPPRATGNGARWIRPQRFHAVHLNPVALRASLEQVPREFTPAAAAAVAGPAPESVIQIPMPDGSLARFRVVESPIMAPELAAKFPEIKTYCGQGLDDPSATVRFDFTPAGLHAQILSPAGTVYVDPYQQGDATLHQSYYRRDYHREVEGLQCLTPTGGAPDFQPAGGFSGVVQFGPTLRTYRIAVSATGEYTQYHGGTVAAGLAAIVTAINRVNGIFETELAIRLVLVANNNLIIFTNASVDPFSNSNPNSLLTQNQSLLDSLIGGANYDVGHCFGTGAGGLSSLSSVCRASVKAQSCTGLPAPVGDSFYVDFVAHEVGHSFGANHSFNGVALNCGANRSANTAYEPGSGSTIMGYAGGCGADDLQNHSEPYFHSVSAAEIQFSVSVGLAADCGVPTSTGNAAPSVNAGLDFAIPKGTPFALTAAGSDLNGDSVTYCWEERDLGPAQLLSAADNGSSPLFRSLAPTTNASRTFPKLNDILNHTTSIGEKMPAISRTMSFRVTARDRRAGGGGVTTDDMIVNVIGSAGPFQVTSPNTAVLWSGPRTVTWSVAGTTAAPINTATVDILLSTNGGASFPVVLAAATPNDGSQGIVLPNLFTAAARIKVQATGNIFFDISDANFTVMPFSMEPQLVLDSPTLTAEGCTPANNLVDPEEVVTVSFPLRNIGTASSTNLVATLNASGGVVPLSGPQNYGAMVAGGAAVSRSFSFLAVGSCGDTITTSLQLLDGSRTFGTVTSQFILGPPPVGASVFTNASAISIPSRNAATPYPSPITVTGLTNPISKVTVTLFNLSHTQPDDLDILLVAPGGQAVLLLSDVGGSTDVNDVTLTFDDAGAPLADGGPMAGGTWVPSNSGGDDTFSLPAPAGPYGTTLSIFNGLLPAGVWSLYVYDDNNQNVGTIANGWSLSVSTLRGPGCCTNASPPTLAISDTSVIEGNTIGTNAQFNVTLSRPLGQSVTVFYATSDGTTQAGNDYVPTNGSVQFNPGQTNRSIGVAVLGDPWLETNETFLVTLSGPNRAVLGKSTGVGTIVDDDIQLAAGIEGGADLRLQFNTLLGRHYRVERTDELSTNHVWTVLFGAELIPGNGSLIPVVDTNALNQPQRFYRVRQVEP